MGCTFCKMIYPTFQTQRSTFHTVMSHKCRSGSKHWQVDCFCNSLFRLIGKHQSSVLLASCEVNSPLTTTTKGQWHGKCFHIKCSYFISSISDNILEHMYQICYYLLIQRWRVRCNLPALQMTGMAYKYIPRNMQNTRPSVPYSSGLRW